MNPILIREWKIFFRGTCPYYFLIFYCSLQLLIFLGVVFPVLQRSGSFGFELEKIGMELAGRLFGEQIILILLLSPFLSVKLMATESEKSIQNLLRIVPYRYWKIILWKYFTSVLIMFLLVLIILPLFLFSLSIGGITLLELGLFIGLLMVFTLCCGGVALFCTLFFNKPDYSLVSAYSSVFILTCFIGHLYYPSSIIFRFLSYSY